MRAEHSVKQLVFRWFLVALDIGDALVEILIAQKVVSFFLDRVLSP